ncbi:hypothetical protein MNBD_GAMMA12-2511 [hydrothermal vent metagenome]|uniref:Uncharacterized protein n=1 Tax=hydrothermal vent metagenome TaxID=652676 RepID=A0A3B0Z206_9ZZZZ
MGYESVADAYRRATIGLTAKELTTHYSDGIDEFHSSFVPHLKRELSKLSGDEWQFDDYVAYAAGSDVDMMGHIVEAMIDREGVVLYPGDWFGFMVGSSHQEKIKWTSNSAGKMACLCIPSVRNGHVTDEMFSYLDEANSCLLNINLYPTLSPAERKGVAAVLNSVLEKSIVSVSFSRGFGMTASQLGVILVHKDNPLRKRYDQQWKWYSYFYNQIATRTFMQINGEDLSVVDDRRRVEVSDWLTSKGLPVVGSGSYYVKSFRPEGDLPDYFRPLMRGKLLRLCFKPTPV